jgi:hypothetical protein
LPSRVRLRERMFVNSPSPPPIPRVGGAAHAVGQQGTDVSIPRQSRGL